MTCMPLYSMTLDTGLNDLAADLQSAVCKFEDMQLDAKKGLACTRGDIQQVEHVLDKN